MSENKIEVFSSAEFGAVRTLKTENGKVIFCGADVAKALGYSNARDALSRHCKSDGVVKRDVVSKTTNQYGKTTEQVVEMKFITEGNVYRLITHSKLPNAERFETWVFDEVLPEIRQTGSYGNVNVEEVIIRAVTLAVSETVKALVPLMQSPALAVTETSEPKRIRKKYKHTTPSKISMLEPELKHKVDEMIISGEYSCQQIANYIMNNSDIEISQMAVNRYKRINFI